MIFKLVTPFSGLTSLVMAIGCTIDGVDMTLLLVLFFVDTKLGVSDLKSRKMV